MKDYVSIYMYKYSNEILVCIMIGVCHVQSVFLQVLLKSGADPRLGADDGERPEQVIGLNSAVYMYIHVRTHTCMYTYIRICMSFVIVYSIECTVAL